MVRMKPLFVAAMLLVLARGVSLLGSGPVGIFGIIEKVAFEPNANAPERLQVWGAFAYVEGANQSAVQVSNVTRGYLYFRLPSIDLVGAREVDAVKLEWADLARVAGTGQAVAFGKWGYIGGFGALQTNARPNLPSVILERTGTGGTETDLRVRPASEAPRTPAAYQTNAGVVKLPETGNHAAIVKELRASLKR
jgi:hypothetical protein